MLMRQKVEDDMVVKVLAIHFWFILAVWDRVEIKNIRPPTCYRSNFVLLYFGIRNSAHSGALKNEMQRH